MNLEDEFLNEVETNIKTHKKSVKRKNSKKKGSRGELELTKILNERFDGIAIFHRTPNSGAFVGGQNFYRKQELNEEQNLLFVGDVYCNRKDLKFTIEHKFYEEPSFWDMFNASSDLHAWMAQAQHDADSVKKHPILIVKYNQKKRIAYIHEKPFNPIFTHNGWNCYWLEDLLKQPNSFFFENLTD